MENIQTQNSSSQLVDAIVEGIQRNKGEQIINLDLSKLNNTECSNFIVCHGNSNTQVEAIAQSVEATVREILGEYAWHTDGFKNREWIVIDYADVMVHIFKKEMRAHYDLESLWADAQTTEYAQE